MLELYNKLAQSFNNLYHWGQDMLKRMKDLTENLETASKASDHQEDPAEPDATIPVPPADPSAAAKP